MFTFFLQVWTPNITRKWAARIEYTLKCEKIVDRSDVTNIVAESGVPVLLDEENEIRRDGLLVSVISAEIHSLLPAMKLREGNVLTPVCDSVHRRGGGSLSRGVCV